MAELPEPSSSSPDMSPDMSPDISPDISPDMSGSLSDPEPLSSPLDSPELSSVVEFSAVIPKVTSHSMLTENGC